MKTTRKESLSVLFDKFAKWKTKITPKELFKLFQHINISTEEKHLVALSKYFSPLEDENSFIHLKTFSEWYFSFASIEFENFHEQLNFIGYFSTLFTKYDVDHSHTLSKDELSELLKELISDQVFLKTYKTDISINDWVQHFDQNFDGLIDFKEFVDGCFSTDMSFFGDSTDPTPNAIEDQEIDDDDEVILQSSFGDFVFLPKYGNPSMTKILSKEVIFKVEQVRRCPGFKFKHNNRYLSVNNGNDQFFIHTNENKETSIKFDDKFLSSDEFGTLSFSTVDNGKNTKWKIKKVESKHKSITEQKESEVSSQQKDLEESFMNGNYKECFKICENNSGPIFRAYLGLLHFNGLGCTKDYSKAKKFFEESKEIPFSLTFLGDIHLSGFNVEKNYDLAYHYFVQSKVGANVNNANYMIGYMFFEEQNFSQAIEHFKIASKNDHMESLQMLKKIYNDGLGIEKDLQKASEIEEHIELIKHHQPENSTSISKKEKQIIEDTKKMEAISNVSSKNYEEMMKKMEQLEKNQVDMKVTLDEHENRLGFIESKLEEFVSQIEDIKETMKKQNEERKKFEDNIDNIIEDLQEKMKKVDAIDDIKNDLSILMHEREQIQKIKKELEYIESVPELKGFFDRVQSKLTEVFLASKVISSGSVKRRETAGEMAIQMATEMFSSVCFTIAKGGMKTVLNAATFGLFALVDIPDAAFKVFGQGVQAVGKVAYKVEQTRQNNKIKTINNLVPSVSKLDKISEDVARILTLRYKDQIMECTCKRESSGVAGVAQKTGIIVSWEDGGAEHLAEAACVRMLDCLFAGHIKYFGDITSQLVDCVFQTASGKWDIPFPFFGIGNVAMITTKKKKRKWTDNGVFCKAGIQIDKKYYRGFDKVCQGPNLYGYRTGTLKEVEELGLVEGVNESPLAVQNPFLKEDSESTKRFTLKKTIGFPKSSKDETKWSQDKLIDRKTTPTFEIPEKFKTFSIGVFDDMNSIGLSAYLYDFLGVLEDSTICDSNPCNHDSSIEWKDHVNGCNESISISKNSMYVKVVICFEFLNDFTPGTDLKFHIFEEEVEICSFNLVPQEKELVSTLVSFQYSNGKWTMNFEEEEFNQLNQIYEGNRASNEEILNLEEFIENHPKSLQVHCIKGKYLNLKGSQAKDQLIEGNFNQQRFKTNIPENKPTEKFKLFESKEELKPFEPEWNQTLKFSIEKIPKDTVLVLTVKDYRLFADVVIGTLFIDLKRASYFQDMWVKLLENNQMNVECEEDAQVLIKLSF